MSAGFGGAGSVQLRGKVAPRGNLKREDRCSYPNLLEPLAFGVDTPQKSALSFGRGRSWRGELCFILALGKSYIFPAVLDPPVGIIKPLPKKWWVFIFGLPATGLGKENLIGSAF